MVNGDFGQELECGLDIEQGLHGDYSNILSVAKWDTNGTLEELESGLDILMYNQQCRVYRMGYIDRYGVHITLYIYNM